MTQAQFSPFLSELIDLKQQGVISGDIETLETSPKVIEEHSRDVSPFLITPEAVLYCKNISDIQTALRLAEKYKDDETNRPIISVRAGGTCMSGGSLNLSLILNMTRYMADYEVNPPQKNNDGSTTYSVTVSMGAMLRDITTAADQFGLMFAPYPSSKDICGVGGVIGNNASGEKSVRHGATIDNVLGMEVVLADGSVIYTGVMQKDHNELSGMLKATELKKGLAEIRAEVGTDLEEAIGNVPKVASGYRLERIPLDGNVEDLTPIFVGAQGTLGIVTKAVLKLTPKPDHLRLIVASVDSIEELPFILETIMKHHPEGVETFDVNTFKRAEHLIKKEMDICARFFNETTTLVVLAQFSEASQAETDAVAHQVEKELLEHPIRVEFIEDETVHDAIWKIRRSSFVLMKDYNAPGFHAVPCIEDIIAPINEFHRLVPGLMAILKKYNLEYGFHGHIGDGSLRIVPVFDFTQGKEKVANQIISFTREAITLVKSLHGNMSADHSDGIIRTPFIREFYGEKVFAAFVKTKLLLDPHGILNRGKKIGGTEETIKKYLID